MSAGRTNPEFQRKLAKLRLKIHPILSLHTGRSAPEFPATLLHFNLLTEAQLDELAHYYSQCCQDETTASYGKSMDWDASYYDEYFGEGKCFRESRRVWVKRRRFGRFIGMRGCDTPVDEVQKRLSWMVERLEEQLEDVKREDRKSREAWRKVGERWWGT
ncbi:hypothetical protein P152DRAFT_400664 [Eremomyces bilateralis CBS 781.70]|uniref:Uncharacterized protein n=1 Tax=Eremomyces bilateralis CBS 781.70 TaxID=1392243 RepID=A0A6G1FY13_9PEZI|nr:uncharacterized protein P152DRAFT_400664 [Eremomyces bilateralis CBS 781.70]KAF1810648.1 hypothetical protein P152DRAFT_400664 [Eremomyces bilateralis CBS 781.70]